MDGWEKWRDATSRITKQHLHRGQCFDIRRVSHELSFVFAVVMCGRKRFAMSPGWGRHCPTRAGVRRASLGFAVCFRRHPHSHFIQNSRTWSCNAFSQGSHGGMMQRHSTSSFMARPRGTAAPRQDGFPLACLVGIVVCGGLVLCLVEM